MLCETKNRFFIDKIGNPYNQILSEDFDFKGESNYFLELLYVVSGCVQITEDEKVYILNEGDIIFYAPMEFHCLKSYKKTTPNIINLSFTVVGELPNKIFDGVYQLNVSQQAQLLKCFELTERYVADNDKSGYLGQYASVSLTALIIDICTQLKQKDAFLSETSAHLYTQIVTTMLQTVYDNFSLLDLAKKHNISVSYLKKLFMTYASVSPKTFYNSLRIKEAVRLLSDGLQISQIAEKMNFSSPNYFSLFFKKHLGLTPMEYKRKNM